MPKINEHNPPFDCKPGDIDEHGACHVPIGVTAIGRSAFRRCEDLTSIRLPNTLRKIGGDAFFHCENLTSITLPDGVRVIGNSAFWNCRSLISIRLPDSLREIGAWAFYGCQRLPSITLPDGLIEIGQWAFWCTALTSITLPDSVREVRAQAFLACTSLAHVTITGSAARIAGSAFERCTSLNHFDISEERINELDDNGSTLLQRVISSLATPDNVIQALVLAGANISNVVIHPERPAGLGAQMTAWRRQYELAEYRTKVQALLNDIYACKAGFGPKSPITLLPNELLHEILFNPKALGYPLLTKEDVDSVKSEMLASARIENQIEGVFRSNVRYSVLNSSQSNPAFSLLVQYGRKQADRQELEAWKAKRGSTAMVPYTPKL